MTTIILMTLFFIALVIWLDFLRDYIKSRQGKDSQANLIERYASAINMIRDRKPLLQASVSLLREHAKSVESEWADPEGAADIEYVANELDKIINTFDQNIPSDQTIL